jgi:hypothetical protein
MDAWRSFGLTAETLGVAAGMQLYGAQDAALFFASLRAMN